MIDFALVSYNLVIAESKGDDPNFHYFHTQNNKWIAYTYTFNDPI